MTEDPGAGAPDPAPGPLEVTVLRSGGVAGMVRRWSAEIPDDGAPAARAARRIAGRGGDAGPPGGQKSGGRVRDGFQWTVTCGVGTLRCAEDERRGDPDLDELIAVITRNP
jgi:hypothetical protein